MKRWTHLPPFITFKGVSIQGISEVVLKRIFGITLLVTHLRYVDFLDSVISAMLMVVAPKCYSPTPNIFNEIKTICPNFLSCPNSLIFTWYSPDDPVIIYRMYGSISYLNDSILCAGTAVCGSLFQSLITRFAKKMISFISATMHSTKFITMSA